MRVEVNGVAISDADISGEASHHAHAPSPAHAAACALAIRELLLQRAAAIGLPDAADGEAIIENLLEREAPAPEPTTAECRRFYEAHPDCFTVGELVETSHILFAVTPNAPVDAIRKQAEATLRQALAAPETFADLASRFSNCPSAAHGGNLGQIRRGEMAPEFERAVFGAAAGVLPRLVNTRFGFHVVRIERSIAGRRVPFERVHERIAAVLRGRAADKAAEQYVRILAARATITGVDLGAAATPLVQ